MNSARVTQREIIEEKIFDFLKEHTKDAPKENTKDAPKEHTKDAPKENTKDAPKEHTRDAQKEITKTDTKNAPVPTVINTMCIYDNNSQRIISIPIKDIVDGISSIKFNKDKVSITMDDLPINPMLNTHITVPPKWLLTKIDMPHKIIKNSEYSEIKQ